jgi:hypothetical protein
MNYLFRKIIFKNIPMMINRHFIGGFIGFFHGDFADYYSTHRNRATSIVYIIFILLYVQLI